MKKLFFELFTSLMLGTGFILVLSPIALYWFIHGDSKRYIWIINGPYPFSSFGEGHFSYLCMQVCSFLGQYYALLQEL
jgi:hypothetical protein